MKHSLPRVSIITPSYNQGDFIEETILSVLSQSYSNIEYILVDGGSTDHTMEVVNRYRDKINIVIHEKDKGQSDAINKGFKLATGQLAGWINSDDILYPGCVQEIVKLYLQNKEAAIFYGSCLNFINEKGDTYAQKNIIIDSLADLLNSDYRIIQQGSFYNLEYLKQVNYVDESIHYSMDLDLWLKLLKLGPVVHFDAHPLGAFRIWENTKTSTGGTKFLTDIRQTLQRHHASPYSANFRRLHWYALKWRIKTTLKAA